MSALPARPRISLRTRLRARLIRLALLLSVATVAAGGVAACSTAANMVVPAAGPLVTVQMRGGHCVEGMCDSRVVLEHDGRVHDGETPATHLGTVPGQAMTTLTLAIQGADWATLKSKPFTGECPVNFDGQELIFEFAAAGGTQRLASCEVEIDWSSPLFVAVTAALGEWIPIPLM